MFDAPPYTRSRFLGGLGLLAASAAAGAPPALGAPLHPAAQKGLDALMAGNARFLADKATCPPLTAHRLALVQGQSPFAIIVSCSDSRVPVETVFDQPPGNIFGIRIAGNFVDDDGLGSIEYSVAELKSSLILVLAHTHCGAVKAAVQFVKTGEAAPSHIQRIVTAIEPAARSARGKPGDWAENTAIANVKETIGALSSRSPIVAKAIEAHSLSLAGGVYDLQSGRVTIVT